MNDDNEFDVLRRGRRLVSARNALLVAFLPLALLAALILLTSLIQLPNDVCSVLFLLLCAISLTCCLKGSFMLFARMTPFGILAGIAFMFLNGFIAIASVFGAFFQFVWWD